MKMRFLAVAGFVFTGLAWLLAIVGVLRGFSIQIPSITFFSWAGGFILIVFRAFILKKIDKGFWVSNMATDLFFSAMVICVFFQFYFEKQGNQLFRKQLYSQALKQYQKVYENHYLQFGYNIEAFSSLTKAAECLCQQGAFEEARNLYLFAMERYSKIEKKIAKNRIHDIDEGLKIVANHETDTLSLIELGNTYQYKLFCNKKAIETYKKVIETTDSEQFRKLASELIDEIKEPEL